MHKPGFFWLLATCCLVPLAPANAQTPQPEDIEVHAARPVTVQSYQAVARVFRRFNALPEQDRANLSLHVLGRLQPDDAPLKASGLHLQTKNGPIPLFNADNDELTVPLTKALWEENPPLMANLTSGAFIGFTFQIAVAPPQPDQFTDAEARHWLRQLNNCMEDVVGVIVAFMLPDAHRLIVSVAPHSRLEAFRNDQTQVLLDNQSDAPQEFVFRPQDYPRDTLFRSTKAFSKILVKIPLDPHASMKRKS
ncbi:DUF2987 domain-containing protein [Acetobacter malorum]|uniref:DUF2987 domain-containing protein n=1 Tax=Acetobacter malorum TaxID=178901 RepID=UPI000A3951AE|nr:DUF2987 domain-containing protein [Acetobacter malorum]